jgi:hypothetical protein
MSRSLVRIADSGVPLWFFGYVALIKDKLSITERKPKNQSATPQAPPILPLYTALFPPYLTQLTHLRS